MTVRFIRAGQTILKNGSKITMRGGARNTQKRAVKRNSVIYKEEFPTKQEAMKREWEIKRLSRKEKLSMIENSKS